MASKIRLASGYAKVRKKSNDMAYLKNSRRLMAQTSKSAAAVKYNLGETLFVLTFAATLISILAYFMV